MNKRKTIIIGVIIFIAVLVIGMLVVTMLLPNNKISNENEVSETSLYEIDHYDDTYVYVNTNGKIVTIEGYSDIEGLEGGTSIATKVGENYDCIIDNNGKIIVENTKYDYIDSALGIFHVLSNNCNYIVSKDDKYALLDGNGKEITNFEYDNISSWMFNNIFYKVEKEEKYGVISNRGKILIEPKYEEDDIKVYTGEGDDIAIIRVGENNYVYNANDLSLICEFKGKSIETDYNSYIYIEDSKTLYIFKNSKLKFEKTNVDFEYILYMEDYINSDYFAYSDSNGNYTVYNYEGKEILNNKSNVIIGKDFLFASDYNDNKVDVYNKDKLIKTIENYKIESSDYTNGNAVILKDSDGYYSIFDKTANKISDKKYYTTNADSEQYRNSYKLSGAVEQGTYSLIEAGTNNYIAVLPTGKIINTVNLIYQSLLYDYDTENYTDKFIMVENSETGKNSIINEEGKIVIENISYSFGSDLRYMCSKLNYICVPDEESGKSIVYDYKSNKKVIEAEGEILYKKEYRIFETDNKIFSLEGKAIYEMK